MPIRAEASISLSLSMDRLIDRSIYLYIVYLCPHLVAFSSRQTVPTCLIQATGWKNTVCPSVFPRSMMCMHQIENPNPPLHHPFLFMMLCARQWWGHSTPQLHPSVGNTWSSFFRLSMGWWGLEHDWWMVELPLSLSKGCKKSTSNTEIRREQIRFIKPSPKRLHGHNPCCWVISSSVESLFAATSYTTYRSPNVIQASTLMPVFMVRGTPLQQLSRASEILGLRGPIAIAIYNNLSCVNTSLKSTRQMLCYECDAFPPWDQHRTFSLLIFKLEHHRCSCHRPCQRF
jgi:hypothetical protein